MEYCSPRKSFQCRGGCYLGFGNESGSLRLSWSREEVDSRLDAIMVEIHKNAYETAERFGMPGNYVAGANIAGFLKVAEAMTAQGMI